MADKNQKMSKIFKKLEKNCKIVKICVFSKQLFVSSWPREGWGGGGHWGLIGGITGVGGISAVGVRQ